MMMKASGFVLLALLCAVSCAPGSPRRGYDLRATAGDVTAAAARLRQLTLLTRRLLARYALHAAARAGGDGSIYTARSESPDGGYIMETPKPKGLMLDPCFSHSECAKGFLCLLPDWSAACSDALDCICVGQVQLCDSCTECPRYPDELCIDASQGLKAGICASAFAVYAGNAPEVGCSSFPSPTPSATVNRTAQPDGQHAPSSSPAIPTRLPALSAPASASPSPASSSTTDGPSSPALVPPSPGARDDDDDGDSDGEDAPDGCVDARVLAHLPPSALVFPAPRLARVLCDASGSCATPGHMVVYRGTPMSMRAYCDSQTPNDPAAANVPSACVATRMLVNSPRYERAWRLRSPHTPGLKFAALAARFESRLEELGLTLAMRMGL